MSGWINNQRKKATAWKDLAIISTVSAIVFVWAGWFDVFERFAAWSGKYNKWQVNEMATILVFLAFALAIFSWRRWRELTHETNRRQDYRNLFRLASDAILIYDPIDGTVLDVNDSACQVYGFQREDFIGRKLQEITQDPAGVRRRLEQVRSEGKVENFEIVHLSAAGSRIYFLINRSLIEYQGRQAILSIERDITERKHAEEALLDAKTRTESILASVADTHIVFDWQWHYLYVNEAAVRAIGRPREQILGRTLWELYPDIVGTELDRQYRRAMDERVAVDFDFHYLPLDSWWENHFYPVREGLAVFATNITERKRAEARSAAFASLARKLSGTVTYFDAARIIGETARDLFGWDACNLDLYEADSDQVFPLLNVDTIDGQQVDVTPLISPGPPTARGRRVIEDGALLILREEPVRFDLEAVPFGDTNHPSASLMSVPIQHGATIIGLLSIQSYTPHAYDQAALNDLVALADHCGEAINRIRDITERRRAEEALRESEERYRELFENSKDAIYVHTMGGMYTSVNRAAEELSGYTREEIIGKYFWDFIALEYVKQVRHYLCEKLDEVGETTYEIDIITKDGRRVPVEVSSRLIYEDGAPIAIQGTARDISERRRAQEVLQNFSRQLIQAQETERQNIARELHDEIGQVLTAVKINLHTVKRSCTSAECLPRIEESVGVVDEALSRVRELSLSLRPALLDDLGLAAALRWYVEHFAERTGIDTELVSEIGKNRVSRDIETACFRIAQEALTNIARHAGATKSTVRLTRTQNGLFLTVADNGVGFDTRLFERTSSALGLRGMTERAEAVKGTLAIHSKRGKGTRVVASFLLSKSRGSSLPFVLAV